MYSFMPLSITVRPLFIRRFSIRGMFVSVFKALLINWPLVCDSNSKCSYHHLFHALLSGRGDGKSKACLDWIMETLVRNFRSFIGQRPNNNFRSSAFFVNATFGSPRKFICGVESESACIICVELREKSVNILERVPYCFVFGRRSRGTVSLYITAT